MSKPPQKIYADICRELERLDSAAKSHVDNAGLFQWFTKATQKLGFASLHALDRTCKAKNLEMYRWYTRMMRQEMVQTAVILIAMVRQLDATNADMEQAFIDRKELAS